MCVWWRVRVFVRTLAECPLVWREAWRIKRVIYYLREKCDTLTVAFFFPRSVTHLYLPASRNHTSQHQKCICASECHHMLTQAGCILLMPSIPAELFSLEEIFMLSNVHRCLIFMRVICTVRCYDSI